MSSRTRRLKTPPGIVSDISSKILLDCNNCRSFLRNNGIPGARELAGMRNRRGREQCRVSWRSGSA